MSSYFFKLLHEIMCYFPHFKQLFWMTCLFCAKEENLFSLPDFRGSKVCRVLAEIYRDNTEKCAETCAFLYKKSGNTSVFVCVCVLFFRTCCWSCCVKPWSRQRGRAKASWSAASPETWDELRSMSPRSDIQTGGSCRRRFKSCQPARKHRGKLFVC